MNLDPDEKELLDSFERGEWKSVAADETARMQNVALREKAAHQTRSEANVSSIDSLALERGPSPDRWRPSGDH